MALFRRLHGFVALAMKWLLSRQQRFIACERLLLPPLWSMPSMIDSTQLLWVEHLQMNFQTPVTLS